MPAEGVGGPTAAEHRHVVRHEQVKREVDVTTIEILPRTVPASSRCIASPAWSSE